MRIIALACALTILCGAVARAQSPRDYWKPGRTFNTNVNANLIYSLADAPVTSKERDQIYDQIYDLVDSRFHRVSYTKEELSEERETVMSSPVGWIKLAEDGSSQLLVQGPTLLFCGTGGCRYWLFVRRHGQLQLALDAFGNFIIGKTSSYGFHDVVMDQHLGMLERVFEIYRWNVKKYEEIDCYSLERDSDNPDKPPKITGCKRAPQ
jgi:hypothetical protein